MVGPLQRPQQQIGLSGVSSGQISFSELETRWPDCQPLPDSLNPPNVACQSTSNLQQYKTKILTTLLTIASLTLK